MIKSDGKKQTGKTGQESGIKQNCPNSFFTMP
jgi:hypothetical protein